MRIISFGLTLDRFINDMKCVTRRSWVDSYAKNIKVGDIISAYDKTPRHGGKKIGEIRVLDKYKEKLEDMLPWEVKCEGFPELKKNEFIKKFFNGYEWLSVWVIWFEKL